MKVQNGKRATRSSSRIAQVTSRPSRISSNKVSKPQPKTSTRARPKKRPALPLALQKYHEEGTVDPNASCRLLGCPREIFDLIVCHLDPEWLVSLSLTCKLSLQYIGTDCWRLHEIRSHNCQSRLNFLTSLIRDAPPELSYCGSCITLHPPLRPPMLHRATKLTKTCLGQWAMIDYIPQVRDDAQDRGYSLLYAHIQQVYNGLVTAPVSIDTLAGHFQTSAHPRFDYELKSSASWIQERLVLQHSHTFRPRGRAPLELKDILSLPVRLCPHLSTVTSVPEKGQYVKGHLANGPLLTHALASAFPPRQRTGLPKSSVFRAPAPSEQKQMDLADAGKLSVWTCRGCTTKFRLEFDRGHLKIETFHCFGDVLHNGKYWEWMVRREVSNLGAGKRNSEYWFPSGRSIPDFAIEPCS